LEEAAPLAHHRLLRAPRVMIVPLDVEMLAVGVQEVEVAQAVQVVRVARQELAEDPEEEEMNLEVRAVLADEVRYASGHGSLATNNHSDCVILKALTVMGWGEIRTRAGFWTSLVHVEGTRIRPH